MPAGFPPGGKTEFRIQHLIPKSSLKWIKNGFADFRMTHPQLASEENSGLGLGVTAALLLGLAGAWRQLRYKRLYLSPGGLIFAGFWIALLFFMIKLGNCGAPRLIAPYYVGLIGLPLLSMQSGEGVQEQMVAMEQPRRCCCPFCPRLAMSPARPLLPMITIVRILKEQGSRHSQHCPAWRSFTMSMRNGRMSYQSVRELLPAGAVSIGFAGTSGESEYSFWLPLGTRRVIGLHPAPGRQATGRFEASMPLLHPTGARMIVLGYRPNNWHGSLDWEIIGTTHVRALASAGATEWCVLVPRDRTKGIEH